MKRALIALLMTGMLLLSTLTQRDQASGQLLAVFAQLEVPNAPIPVKADGKIYLLYELHVTNFRAAKLELARVEVFGGDGNAQPIASYQDTELIKRLHRPGAPTDLADKRLIGGGLRAVVFLHLIFNREADVPRTLRHRLLFKPNEATPKEAESMVDGARVVVGQSKPLVIGSPLRGEGWLAANGPSNDSGHRRTIIVLDGRARVPQRFATDWVKLGPDGRLFHDDPSQNANWYDYGVEVLAVADAAVVAIKDGLPENVPLAAQRVVPVTLETVAGNHIILDLGGGHFALYAHLQPGSLRVKVGEKVRRGQVLALLGNTGNSDAPHLHFHIADANSPLGAEGLPFVFDSFETRGIVQSLDALFGREAWKPQPGLRPGRRRLEIPIENAVVSFP
ncbi:MAG TPA: M23 family metallopeptidase [Pyrinomonadaceae bacterium]|jgi:hypothetical protein